MHRPERIHKIMKLLSGGKRLTQDEFLSRLEVSEATFKRDLVTLRDQMNAPVIWSRQHRAYMIDTTHSETGNVEFLPGT